MKTDLELLVSAVADDPGVWPGVVDELQAADRWNADTVRRLVTAYPAADGPRWVAAAWFDGPGGDPQRAELIRVQLELAAVESRMKIGVDAFLRDSAAHGVETTRMVWEINNRQDVVRRDVLKKRQCEIIPPDTDRAQQWWRFRDDIPAGFAEDHPVGWWSGNTGLGNDPHSHCFMAGDVRRGYVEEVWVPWTRGWERIGDQLLEHQPVRVVNVDRVPTFQWEPTDRREMLLRFKIAGKSLTVSMNDYAALVHGSDQLRLLLRKRWPGVEIKWPMGTGTGDDSALLYPTPAAEHYVFRPGDMVSVGGDGRLVPTPGREHSLMIGTVLHPASGKPNTYAVSVTAPWALSSPSEFEASPLPPATRFAEYVVGEFSQLEPGDPVFLEIGGRSVGRCRRGDRCIGYVQRVVDPGSALSDYPPVCRVRVRLLPKPEVWK